VSAASDWGGAPSPQARGRGLSQRPRENKLLGQQEALAKAARALAPSGARETGAPVGPRMSYGGPQFEPPSSEASTYHPRFVVPVTSADIRMSTLPAMWMSAPTSK